LFLFVVGFVALVSLGSLGGGIFWFIRSQETSVPTWSDPLSLVNANSVEPSSTVWALTARENGDAEGLARAAAADQWDTAYAILVYSSTLSDRERLGGLLLAAQGYSAKGKRDQALQCYQQARDLAVLSPALSDHDRAEALLQAGANLSPLGERTIALAFLDQAYTLAVESPQFKSFQRVFLLDKLIATVHTLDEGREREYVKAKSKFAQSEDDVVFSAAEVSLPQDKLPASGAIQAVQDRRTALAQRLAEQLAKKPADRPSALIRDLGEALKTEDEIRLNLYDAQIADSTSLVTKAAWAKAKADWLVLKYRVARRAFGLGLVPAWESEASQIRSALAMAYEDYFAIRLDQAYALPNAGDVDPAVAWVLRQEIALGRAGLYPNYAEAQLVAALEETMERLVSDHPGTALRVLVKSQGTAYLFLLVSDENYATQKKR